MKKLVTLVLCLMMVLTSAALAEGMGVQVIGGPGMEIDSVSLDDIKLNIDIDIEGYGVLTPTTYEVVDRLGSYGKGNNSDWYKISEFSYFSGNEAQFAMLRMDIVNTQLIEHDFLNNVSVKVVYDDKYEFGGWYYQYNYNNGVHGNDRDGFDLKHMNTTCVVKKEDQFAISPMYAGHYVFGCTLPNSVIDAKKPMKMIITIDGNEITYNIRK